MKVIHIILPICRNSVNEIVENVYSNLEKSLIVNCIYYILKSKN